MQRIAERGARLVACVALVGLPACAIGSRSLTTSHASQAGMPCSEADRVAKGALFRLGYEPQVVTAARPGAPGSIVGKKNTGWSTASPEPGTEYTATVTVTCSNQGAEFAAQTDEPIPASLTFKGDFAAAIGKVATRGRTTRPRIAERPEVGLVISVEPLRGGESSSEFGADLNASGITPVRVKIENRSDRTYDFTAEGVQLVTQEGERVEPLDVGAGGKLSASLQAKVRDKRIADGRIAPQGALAGYLYFPASAYRRATLVLIDQATEEPEGFSVEF